MHSSPSFDPNLFIHGISHQEWNSIRNNPLKPLVNKTVAGLYSPGSTIKPIVALSALENKIISPSFKVNCTGKMELYGQTYHCWKKKGHGVVNLRKAIKQSCDTYFYEVGRKLGIDRLNSTALKFGLGNKVLNDSYLNEKKGLVPSTEWKKNTLGKGWVLGESLITGIGQGYIQTTPLQLCLMTAQLANGGHKIYPRIVVDKNQISAEDIKNQMIIADNENKAQSLLSAGADFFKLDNKKYSTLYENQKNVKYVLESMFSSTNEVSGTSYSSRIDNPKYQFAGKTGTSQVKRITAKDRELELKTNQIPYEERDHALYVAFGPYKNPRYAVSIIVEHGGSGSSSAAPLAKKLFKLIIDRHELREAARKKNTILT
jgi:penicillin-binding protein 2